MYILVSRPSSLARVYLDFNSRTLLFFVNYSVFGPLREGSAGWDLAPLKTDSSYTIKPHIICTWIDEMLLHVFTRVKHYLQKVDHMTNEVRTGH